MKQRNSATPRRTICHEQEMPDTVLVLLASEIGPDEVVVQRSAGRERVFLFESVDDAYDGAQELGKQLGFVPAVARMAVADLPFRRARYKPADSDAFNIGKITIPENS
jgi:hypothetical protein